MIIYHISNDKIKFNRLDKVRILYRSEYFY